MSTRRAANANISNNAARILNIREQQKAHQLHGTVTMVLPVTTQQFSTATASLKLALPRVEACSNSVDTVRAFQMCGSSMCACLNIG